MCDTLAAVGRAVPAKVGLFGKNSDRSPNEPCLTLYVPGGRQGEKTVNCTYISVEQAAETLGAVLCRPSWTWGAEMGVNEAGVAIGNEAVFTKGGYGKPALIGMDLVRLALERADTAEKAVEVIIGLLERYGQGGNCGFDHRFHYDNSFLAADQNGIYVLDTVGKSWAVRKMEGIAAISNRMSIEDRYDRASEGVKPGNFSARFTNEAVTMFSGADARVNQTLSALQCGYGSLAAADIMEALRSHDHRYKPYEHSVDSVCMHYGGMVGDHTVGSLVAELKGDKTKVWVTGASTPCIRPFIPVAFRAEGICFADERQAAEHWLKRETLWRLIQDRMPPAVFLQDMGEEARTLETRVYNLSPAEAAVQEEAFLTRWAARADAQPQGRQGDMLYRMRWAAKTKKLGKDIWTGGKRYR